MVKIILGPSEVSQFCLGYVGRLVLVNIEIALGHTEFVSTQVISN